MSERDYYETVEGWQLRDQKEWAKFRLVAYFAANSQFMKKSLGSLDKIVKLPLIDGQLNDKVEENINYLLDLKRKADEKRKAKETPASA